MAGQEASNTLKAVRRFGGDSLFLSEWSAII